MVIVVVLIRLVHKSCIEIFFPSIRFSPREKWEIAQTPVRVKLYSDVTSCCELVWGRARWICDWKIELQSDFTRSLSEKYLLHATCNSGVLLSSISFASLDAISYVEEPKHFSS